MIRVLEQEARADRILFTLPANPQRRYASGVTDEERQEQASQKVRGWRTGDSERKDIGIRSQVERWATPTTYLCSKVAKNENGGNRSLFDFVHWDHFVPKRVRKLVAHRPLQSHRGALSADSACFRNPSEETLPRPSCRDSRLRSLQGPTEWPQVLKVMATSPPWISISQLTAWPTCLAGSPVLPCTQPVLHPATGEEMADVDEELRGCIRV